MSEEQIIHLRKAEEALAGAESEFANGRFNNCATRCYYGTFHAAIYALGAAGLRPRSDRDTLNHAAVQAAFAGDLIQRRKLYSSDLQSILLRNQTLRNTADYERHLVTELQAARALRNTRLFVGAVMRKAGIL